MDEVINTRNELDETQRWKERMEALLEVMSIRDEQLPIKTRVAYLETLWAAGKISEQEYRDEACGYYALNSYYDERQREQFAVADKPQRRGVPWMGRRAIRSVVRPFQSR